MASRKQKGLTHKEQVLVRNLANGKNISQSALAAGYSAKHPGQSGWQALQNIRLKMPELLASMASLIRYS
jgi:phage terminase small subunit